MELKQIEALIAQKHIKHFIVATIVRLCLQRPLKRISNLLISKMLHVQLKIACCPHYSASLSMLSSSLLQELLLSLSFSCSCVLLFFVVSVILSNSLRECPDRFSFISLME